MSTITGQPGTSGLLLPERRRLHGPITSALQRRALAILSVPWALGLALVVFTGSARWHAFGLGLLFPGGGFLSTSDVPLFVAALAVFLLAFALFWVLGPVLAPPSAWLGAAGLATLRTHAGTWDWADWGVPALLLAAIGAGLAVQRVAERRAWRAVPERNRLLAAAGYVAPKVTDALLVEAELAPEDLAVLRFVLDLALQPVERFDGFEFLDQFREAAVRYQLNYAGWGLALLQFTRAPAFTGYLAEAQRNLIEKMTNRRVWSYWRWENLWGNLDPNPDPIRRDNIMLSGYFAAQIGAYETVSGDHRYDEPGALTFRWSDKRAFPYDFGSIAAAVHHGFSNSRFCMFPCEPNWVYPLCNLIAMCGLVSHDRLHGSKRAEDVFDQFRHAALEEFTTPDGRPTSVRASRIGMTMPGVGKSTANEGFVAFWLNPTLPDAAARAWAITREQLLSIDANGRAIANFQTPLDRLDIGRYKFGWGFMTYAFICAAAREMGDEEMYRALLATMANRGAPSEHDGAFRYKGSTSMNVTASCGRFGARNAWHHLIRDGMPDAWRTGPVLAEAPYPDVLVAQAVSDGKDLRLVLRPGGSGGRVPLVVERLRPDRHYDVRGGADDGGGLVADQRGRGIVRVDLDDRRELRLVPSS